MSAAKQSTILKYLSMGLLLHSTKCGIPRNDGIIYPVLFGGQP